MRNSAELRRFSSHHPSLSSWIFRLKWQGNGGQGLYKEGGPCRPLGGRHAPLLFFFGHGPRCKFEEKKLHLGHVAPHRATGGYFWKFSKRTYIFEILIFFNIKKKKVRHPIHRKSIRTCGPFAYFHFRRPNSDLWPSCASASFQFLHPVTSLFSLRRRPPVPLHRCMVRPLSSYNSGEVQICSTSLQFCFIRLCFTG